METDGCNERAMLPRNDKQEIWTDLHCWRNGEGEFFLWVAWSGMDIFVTLLASEFGTD